MYSLPFLLLKATRWHFFQLYTFYKDSGRKKCKVGENAVLGLSKPELVRNACFYIELVLLTYVSTLLECYMDWFHSLICKNYIFKHFVKTVEPMSLKFCTIIELITLHLEYTIAQVKYANFSYAHAQTFSLLNGEMATVSTGFRKLKFWLWLLQTVSYLNQTGF